MTKCKKRSMMLLKVEDVRGEQLRRAAEAHRLAWSGIQFPSNGIELRLCVSAQVGAYYRSNPLVFSLMPRCHGLCGSLDQSFPKSLVQSNTADPELI